MRLHYKELKKLIDIDKLEQLEAVNLTMIEQILDQMEQKIEQRGGLSGYDSTFMNPIKYGFVNKNWNVKDEIWEKKMINRIFSVMKRYRENISMHFFVDFCHLFLSIENSCSNHIRAYINHIVMEHMVNEDFFLEQKKSGNLNHDMWDGPYKLARIDDGSQNQYEVMVSLLLVSGMTALTEEEKPKAIKYMLKALSVDEFVIYNYATVMFSYFFLKGKQLCEDSRNGEVITSLAWGGLQFISGRLAAENIMNEEEFAEIKNWVHKALDAMAESEKWFGTEGFHVYAGKNEEYIEWLAAMNYTLKCG